MACESERIRPDEVRSWRLIAQRKTKAEAGFRNVKPRVVSSASGGETVAMPPEGNIAAIDFGTTYCSLAYTTEGDPNANCIKPDGYNSRVPTAILLKKKDTADSSASIPCAIIAFGSQANFHLRAKDADKHLYFERMKMNLQHDPDVHREMTIQAQNGTHWYLIEVIAFIMRHLKDLLEERLSRTFHPLKAVQFNWVITVPAIWQARGRGMMREAAYMAGLCSDVPAISCFTKVGQKVQRPLETNHEHLTLAPEPEAAALYCQHMTQDQLAPYCDQVSTFKSHQYVVLDIGGGTVDITAQKCSDSGDIEVLQAPTGNSWGGTSVNRELVKLLQKIVGEEGDPFDLETAFPSFFQNPSISSSNKAALVEAVYKTFELQKETFGSNADMSIPKTDERHIYFRFPDKFYRHYKLDQRADQYIPEIREKEIERENDEFFIYYHKAQELFKPAIDNILECTERVLSKLSGQMNTIYLVGGFGGCKYVYEHISHLMKTKFSASKYQLVVPQDHKLAVALGAIQFCQPTTVFKSRVMDASYGLAVSVPFVHGTHSTHYFKCDEDGNKFCTDAFLTFIDEGETAQSSEVAVDDIVPLVDNVHEVSIPIYRSHVPTEYITDRTSKQVTPIAHKVGELLMEIPRHDITHKTQRVFRIMFDFSGTEIQVVARYISNEEQVVGVALDFLKK